MQYNTCSEGKVPCLGQRPRSGALARSLGQQPWPGALEGAFDRGLARSLRL